jgi:hypothetical protein
MRRAVIHFDEDTYQKLMRRAFEAKQSVSSIVRELVAEGLVRGPRKKFIRVEQFSSVIIWIHET